MSYFASTHDLYKCGSCKEKPRPELINNSSLAQCYLPRCCLSTIPLHIMAQGGEDLIGRVYATNSYSHMSGIKSSAACSKDTGIALMRCSILRPIFNAGDRQHVCIPMQWCKTAAGGLETGDGGLEEPNDGGHPRPDEPFPGVHQGLVTFN